MDDNMDSSDILFLNTTAVVHISGNKESGGRIINTNQGLSNVFGYNKTEVMSHQVNILMPSLFAKRHNEFIDEFFKTGYETVFNTERTFYGVHRNGFCFCIELFIKKMPNLVEGIRYVGMIQQKDSEYEFIITDTRGVIDSFSSGISSLLNLPISLFKENNINIQIIAPMLIKVFTSTDKKRTMLSKFQEPGGQKLTFIVPKDFHTFNQVDHKKNIREMSKNLHIRGPNLDVPRKTRNLDYREINRNLSMQENILDKQFSPQFLMKSQEYREWEIKQVVRCEILDLIYGSQYKEIEPLKVRVFKIAGANSKQFGNNIEQGSEFIENPYETQFSIGSVKDAIEDNACRGEKKEAKELSNVNEQMENKGKFPVKTEEDKSRMESLATEKLPDNIVSTEERVEVLEPRLIHKTEEVNKVEEGSAQNSKAESGKKQEEGPILICKREKADTESEEVKGMKASANMKGSEELSTPRIGLESLRGPEAIISRAEENPAPPSEDIFLNKNSLNSEESEKKEEQKLAKASHYYVRANTNKFIAELNSIKMQKQPTANKPGTTIYDKTNFNLHEKLKPCKNAHRNQSENRITEEFKGNYIGEVSPPEIINLEAEEVTLQPKLESPGMKVHNDSKMDKKDSERKPTTNAKGEAVKVQEGLPQLENVKDSQLRKDSFNKSVMQEDGKRSSILKAGRGNRLYKSRVISDEPYDPGKAEYIEVKIDEDEEKLRRSLVESKLKKGNDKKREEKVVKKEVKKVDSEDEEEEEEEESKSESEEENLEKETYESIDTNTSSDKHNDQGSVTSGVKNNAVRSFYSLRAAIDEKFTPPSIYKMTYIAVLVFLLLLVLSITYFVMTIILYSNIKDNIRFIDHSEQRHCSLVNINFHLINMMIISADYNQHQANENLNPQDSFVYIPVNETKIHFVNMQNQIKSESNALKNAQTELSMNSEKIPKDTLDRINPSVIVIQYLTGTGEADNYTATMWETMMKVIVSSHNIACESIGSVNDTSNSHVYFLSKNSLNSLLMNLDGSVDAVMNEIEVIKNSVVTTFTILLIIASSSVFLSTILLIPVVNKMKKNKQDVLELFMRIKKSSANEEMERCKKFLGIYQAHHDSEMIGGEGEEVEDNADTTTEQIKKLHKVTNYGTSTRKFKRLALNLGLVLFKFIFLILILAGYFILSYFLASTFLNRVVSLTTELRILIARLPTNKMLLIMEKSIIFKNYDVTFYNRDPAEYMEEFQNKMHQGEEELLNNYDYHTSNYNDKFNSIIFSNVCRYLPVFASELEECESFSQGILQKGIYSSVIKYWDYIRQLNYDFYHSNRSEKVRYEFLNNEKIIMSDAMQGKYLNISINYLIIELQSDIDNFFKSESTQNIIIFVIYNVYLIVVYIFFWNGFISGAKEELWKTKSILSIIPPTLIMSITDIKDFILKNSSTVYLSNKKH